MFLKGWLIPPVCSAISNKAHFSRYRITKLCQILLFYLVLEFRSLWRGVPGRAPCRLLIILKVPVRSTKHFGFQMKTIQSHTVSSWDTCTWISVVHASSLCAFSIFSWRWQPSLKAVFHMGPNGRLTKGMQIAALWRHRTDLGLNCSSLTFFAYATLAIPLEIRRNFSPKVHYITDHNYLRKITLLCSSGDIFAPLNQFTFNYQVVGPIFLQLNIWTIFLPGPFFAEDPTNNKNTNGLSTEPCNSPIMVNFPP